MVGGASAWWYINYTSAPTYETQEVELNSENQEADSASTTNGQSEDATTQDQETSDQTNVTPEREIPLEEVPEEQQVDDRGGGVYY